MAGVTARTGRQLGSDNAPGGVHHEVHALHGQVGEKSSGGLGVGRVADHDADAVTEVSQVIRALGRNGS